MVAGMVGLVWSEDGTEASSAQRRRLCRFAKSPTAGSMMPNDWALGPVGDRDSRVALIPSLDPTGQSVIEHASSQPEKMAGARDSSVFSMASLAHHQRPTVGLAARVN